MRDKLQVQRREAPKRFSAFNLASVLIFIALLSASCQEGFQVLAPMGISSPSPTAANTPALTPLPADSTPSAPTQEQVISTPTLAPTVTPGPLDFAIEEFSQTLGVSDLILFGLNAEDLFNLLISILIVLLGILAGKLIDGFRWLAKYTPTHLDELLLGIIHKQLKWLVALLFLTFATARLTFLSPEFKQLLDLIYFSILVVLVTVLLWNLVDYLLKGPLVRASSPENRTVLVTFTPLLRRVIKVLMIALALAVILQNFGVNLSALLAILGLGGLAISLAAKETLEDMISGFIILVDRPYQVGDRIKIETMDTWGDVESIGSRTTRIRTMDNRLVIVPNSIIGREQVENFTYPDPSYRQNISIGVAYGSDLDLVEEVIAGAVMSIPEVLQDKAPMVEFTEFGDSAIIIRVHYWLNAYANVLVRSDVNKAIYQALEEAGVEMPFVTYDVNLAYKEQQKGEDEL
jgi:small-conductance mechanosensitive channel